MGAIFLSYAREDRGCAEKLAHVLENAGHEVWWDRRLDGGEEFSAEIEAALDKSDVVLVAWSKESVKSRWVRDEAAVGGESGQLVPVSIDGSLPPMGFRQFHTLDLTGWKGGRRDGRTAELLHSVERRLQTKGKDPEPAPRPSPAKRRVALPTGKGLWVIVVILLLVGAAGAGLIYRNARQTSDEPIKPSIALLPFTMASPDPELRAIASQARDSLADTFSKSGLPLRVLAALPQGSAPPADFLLLGDLGRNGDKIVATIRLEEAAHSATVYTHEVEAGKDDARDLPERIGAQIAATLTGADTLLTLDRRHPLDPSVIAELFSGNFNTSDPLQDYQQAKRAVAKAPDSVAAQLAVAFNGAFALGELPRDERRQVLAEARQAAERSIALAPKFGDAYGAWCALHSGALMAECEDRLREAKRIDPDAPWVNTFLSHLLRGVGRIDEAAQLARMSQTHDVYVPQKIGWLLRLLEYSGDSDEAQQFYEQGARWWPGLKPMLFRNRIFGLIDRGDFEAISRLEQKEDATKLVPGYSGTGPLVSALKSRSLAAARQACPGDAKPLLKVRCMLVLASLGDEDGAYAIADELYPRTVGRSGAETEQLWLDDPDAGGDPEFITSPAAGAMRRDPRYLALAQRTGLLAYWRSGRLPDFCRKNPEPICGQLRGRH